MGYILPFILTAIFTVITGIVVWWLTKDKLHLSYKITESDPFPNQGGNSKYFIVVIKNEGNKLLEDIISEINFFSGKVSVYKITDENIVTELTQDDNSIKFKIPSLNPKEEINCIATLNNITSKESPSVYVRAKGATAKEKNESLSKFDSVKWITSLMAIGALVFTISQLLFSSYSGRTNFSSASKLDSLNLKYEEAYKKSDELKTKLEEELKKDEEGNPDRIEILFSIFNKAGLAPLFSNLLSTSNDDISYVGAAFFLVHNYVKDIPNKEKYVNALRGITLVDKIAPSTKGMAYYLLAKIEQNSNNPIIADEYLNKCKTETPLMYNHLMEQDKYYNLPGLSK